MTDQKELPASQELKDLRVLRGIDVESTRGILEQCAVRRFKRDEILIHANEPNHFLYVLLAGRLRIHLKLDLDPVTVLEAGEVVGELSLVDQELTSAYVVADDDCRLLVVDEKTMWSLVDASPVARNLLFVFARRLRKTDDVLSVSQQLQHDYLQYAVTDALTGLYNRRWLDSVLSRQMERYKKNNNPLSLLIIDIDGFKKFNDTYGHVTGDRVLYTVAQSLLEHLRPAEILVRYAGDEFIVLLPDTDASTSQKVGDRIREAVGNTPIKGMDKKVSAGPTISIGIAEMSPEDTAETFIDAADQALYSVKASGGNQVAVNARLTSGSREKKD